MTIYGIAAMCIFFLTFAMQPDVIDYSEYRKCSVAGLIAAFQGVFRSVLIAVLTYFYKLDSIRGEMTEELEKRR